MTRRVYLEVGMRRGIEWRQRGGRGIWSVALARRASLPVVPQCQTIVLEEKGEKKERQTSG